MIIELFENIKIITGQKIINSFKSWVLGQLMICYNIIKYNKQYDEELHNYIKNEIIKLLDKCIRKQAKDKPTSDTIIFTFKAYLFVTKTITKNKKLEKGEMGVGDDLIILANEYYYEKYGEEKNGKELTSVPLALVVMVKHMAI